MSGRKRPYVGEMIQIINGHKVVEVSESSVTIEVTRFKGNEPFGTGRMNIPLGYLKYHKDINQFILKNEYQNWFRDERCKVDLK